MDTRDDGAVAKTKNIYNIFLHDSAFVYCYVFMLSYIYFYVTILLYYYIVKLLYYCAPILLYYSITIGILGFLDFGISLSVSFVCGGCVLVCGCYLS